MKNQKSPKPQSIAWCSRTQNEAASRKNSWLLSTCALLILWLPATSYGALVNQQWISKDKSKATVTLRGGESIKLPKKGGGEVTIECKGAVGCSLTLADFKDKKGNVTYDTNLSGLQAMTGAIDKGFATFEITTTGDWEGLFTNSIVTASLIDSTGFNATVGVPGDQIPQGGTIDYSTRWLSEGVIGFDPATMDEITLGDFFLDSSTPLTAFEYDVIDSSAPIIAATFTIGEIYRFSTGLEITGEVTKEMIVPEPEAIALFSVGLIAFFSSSSKRLIASIRRLRRSFKSK
ncbi:hypothetical protein HCH_00511 [Hahella chejuensis KCTC 2396]|uniref:PEP-CTERM protein-sorting domain-containing protein n=1 Tax=Hahella chejuensis (strain KCTC 2396) TaxID=349521 RepID=Q2SPK6_HAHCH|nr:PEP-CTERM domain protein [Hahella chejuensis]ABC27418.1 hypothetical protein HCH_00511 [Hahella chejuensis KCTC 2396]